MLEYHMNLTNLVCRMSSSGYVRSAAWENSAAKFEPLRVGSNGSRAPSTQELSEDRMHERGSYTLCPIGAVAQEKRLIVALHV